MTAFAKFFEDNAASLFRDWIPTPGIDKQEGTADFLRFARECYEELQYMGSTQFQMDMFDDTTSQD